MKLPEKILLLGSGELGKEVVIAVDKYSNAPAMQVADDFEVIDMLNGSELQRMIDRLRTRNHIVNDSSVQRPYSLC